MLKLFVGQNAQAAIGKKGNTFGFSSCFKGKLSKAGHDIRNVKRKNLVTPDGWSKVEVQFGPDIQGN